VARKSTSKAGGKSTNQTAILYTYNFFWIETKILYGTILIFAMNPIEASPTHPID
jgi:hypothetical protein